ncbi:hypothetical protein MHYP_G00362000 [Metynnis hypsauchen]
MFHIVIFESTNELEVVPEMWVKKNTCLWPPYKRDEIVKAVISQEPPGALWVPYKVRTILSKALNAGKSGNERTAISECE